MSKRKELITLEYHSDDDTGMYHVGEIDFGISGELDDYLERYGQKGMDSILKIMSHLIWHIQEYGYKIIRKNDAQENDCKTSTPTNSLKE